jgi:hypothetical protein
MSGLAFTGDMTRLQRGRGSEAQLSKFGGIHV